ncbi:hypothetical protein [Rhodanobacter sp. C03]|uniref:hypothetical protein n=1 Tax=Rhodanobacter sp. C03 TaxID=1945858 RepID=UPI0009866003|nr:hypothetical protein [Rhodanobacter sp. C03]OOG55663.1 hypothetical protein B0E48_12650 [Rhodanobacter sp. C03]
MRATHWLIGCALCIVGIGSAAAANLDTQEQDSAQHTATDNSSSRDANNTGGDALGLSRDTPSHSTGSDGSGNTSSNGNDRSSGAPSTPARARQPHLGWQSLLPGSIQ